VENKASKNQEASHHLLLLKKNFTPNAKFAFVRTSSIFLDLLHAAEKRSIMVSVCTVQYLSEPEVKKDTKNSEGPTFNGW
jgi:hypothetical protein